MPVLRANFSANIFAYLLIGWGVDFDPMANEGMLKIVCRYPETTGLENHLIKMKEIIQDFQPNRVAVDSLFALERVSSLKGFREFIIALTSFIKQQEVGGLFTSTTPTLLGGTSITEHDKDIREFSIDAKGMHVRKPFRNVTGILAGTPMYMARSEVERLTGLFDS